jgi:hypothetical protein
MAQCRLLRHSAVLAACGFSASLAFVSSLTREMHAPHGEPGIALEREDPQARFQFDWMRLHDPATGKIPEGIRTRELAFARTIPSRASLLKADGSASRAEISWQGRGPGNVGGRTRALAVDVGNPNTILAGGVSAGMWKSTDGGGSWRKVTAPSQLHSVTCIVQDTRPGKTSTWYYGTGELTGNSASGGGSALYRGDGIFKSTDNGETWAQLASTVSGSPQVFVSMFQYVWDIVLNPSSSSDEVYAATIGGVNRTTVLGGQANNNSRYTDIAVTSDGVFYASLSDAQLNGSSGAVSQGIWRSTDGATWVNIRPITPPWPTVFKRIVIGIAPSNEHIVYFMGETPGFGKQTGSGADAEYNSFWRYRYVSGAGTGAGGAWENRSANLPGFGGNVGDFLSQGSYNLVVKVSPLNDSLVFAGCTNLYRSTNGFRTTSASSWIGGYNTTNDYSQYPSHHCDQHAIVFAPNNPLTLYSGNDGGVFRTSDCTAASVVWTSLNRSYLTTQFYTLAIDHATSGSNVIIGGMQDNGTWFGNSTDAGSSWADLFSGDGASCAVADNRTSYYVSAQEGVIYRLILTSAGVLQGYARVDPTGGANYLFIAPFVLDPSNNSLMYLAAGSELWRNSGLASIPMWPATSADNTTSVNWTRMTGSTVGTGDISALGVSRQLPASRLYFGTSGGSVLRLDNASSASAATVPVDIGSNRGLPQGGYVSSLAVDPTNGTRVLLVFSNYGIPSVYYSSNAGGSWTNVSGNLEQNPDGSGDGPSVRWGAIQSYGGGADYFLGTSTGLYSTESLQGGETVWAQEGSTTIGNLVVDMVDARSVDGLIAVATHGQGIFSGFAPAVNPPPEEIPSETRLEPNFPNPFNPYTVIRFTLKDPGHVTLKIYTVTGAEITTLIDEDRAAGLQPDVIWRPQSLASGVYLYDLRTASAHLTRKMVYVK